VPGESDSLTDGLHQLLVGTTSVGVSHIVQHGDGKFGWVTGGACSGEAQDTRGRRAVGGRDLVIVRSIRPQVGDLDLMEKLAALCYGYLGAGRGAVVTSSQPQSQRAVSYLSIVGLIVQQLLYTYV
jgi:hypothetical protein